jgi:hypothetical protein
MFGNIQVFNCANQLRPWQQAFGALRQQALELQSQNLRLRADNAALARSSQGCQTAQDLKLENARLRARLERWEGPEAPALTAAQIRMAEEAIKRSDYLAEQATDKADREKRASAERVKRWAKSNELQELARAEIYLLHLLWQLAVGEYTKVAARPTALVDAPDFYCKLQKRPSGCKASLPAEAQDRTRYLFFVQSYENLQQGETLIDDLMRLAPGSESFERRTDLVYSDEALRNAIRSSQRARAELLSRLNAEQIDSWFPQAKARLESMDQFYDFSPDVLRQVLQIEQALAASVKSRKIAGTAKRPPCFKVAGNAPKTPSYERPPVPIVRIPTLISRPYYRSQRQPYPLISTVYN